MALLRDWCEVLRAQLHAPGRYTGALPDFPPATEQQLRLTEERLGFALPTTLRRLYAEVANGGDVFRRGSIVYGAMGGCRGYYSPEPIGTIDQRLGHSDWRLSERVGYALQRHPEAYVQCEEAPDCFVSIGEHGCESSIALDGLTGRLYQMWCGDNLQFYSIQMGQPIEPGSEDGWMQAIAFYAASVDDWIEREMNTTRLPSAKATELTQEMLRDSGEP
jgi:hypothetical protein